jgi:chromosome segregation ATPase
MADEEIQRAIEFIVQQQAKYAARLEKDEPRLARLEDSFKMLVELARGADERQDTMGETMATLSHTMNELMRRTITDESRVTSLEASFKMLVELARGTDERLDQNAARLERDESRLARLEESFTMLVELAHRHDERVDR